MIEHPGIRCSAPASEGALTGRLEGTKGVVKVAAAAVAAAATAAIAAAAPSAAIAGRATPRPVASSCCSSRHVWRVADTASFLAICAGAVKQAAQPEPFRAGGAVETRV